MGVVGVGGDGVTRSQQREEDVLHGERHLGQRLLQMAQPTTPAHPVLGDLGPVERVQLPHQ